MKLIGILWNLKVNNQKEKWLIVPLIILTFVISVSLYENNYNFGETQFPFQHQGVICFFG